MRMLADATCPRRRIVELFAFLVLVLTVVALAVLFLAPPAALGQAGAAPARIPLAQKSQAAAAVPTPAAAAPSPALAASPAAKPDGGMSQNIRVHGHWVIEVRNPDGSLAARREFENSLSSGNNGNGAALLAALLGRSLTGGSWGVVLWAGGWAFVVSEANSGSVAYCQNLLTVQGAGAPISCFSSLSIAAPTYNSNSGAFSGTTLTLSGSFTVPQSYPSAFPTSFSQVQTFNIACAPSDSPATCFGQEGAFLSLTTRNLDGLNGDPPAVPFTPGQAVNVNVTLSFQ